MFTDNYTDITMLIDRSGSMASVAEQTVDGFAAFIGEQRTVETPARLSLIQFDDRYERVYTERALSRVGPLKFQPRGMTALLDAMGRAITETERRLHTKALRQRPRQVLFVTITDGLENSSREFSRDQILELVERQRDNFDWQFVYLGANQDAIAEGGRLGLRRDCAMTYDASAQGMGKMWQATAAAVARHRKRGPADAAMPFFTEEERGNMKD